MTFVTTLILHGIFNDSFCFVLFFFVSEWCNDYPSVNSLDVSHPQDPPPDPASTFQNVLFLKKPENCSRQLDFTHWVGDMLDKWKNEKQKHIDKKCLLKKKIKLKDKNGWEAQHTELRIKKTSYILP